MSETKPTKCDLINALKAELSPKAKELFTELHKIFPGVMLTEIKDAFKPSAPEMDRAQSALLARTEQTIRKPIQRAPHRSPGANVVQLEPDHLDR